MEAAPSAITSNNDKVVKREAPLEARAQRPLPGRRHGNVESGRKLGGAGRVRNGGWRSATRGGARWRAGSRSVSRLRRGYAGQAGSAAPDTSSGVSAPMNLDAIPIGKNPPED